MNQRGWRLSASLAFAAAALAASQAVAAISVEVVSSRPDLVTGGDALLKVTGATAAPTVAVDGKDVAIAFKPDGKGGFVGLVTGLKDGDNLVAVKAAPDSANGKLGNHPI